MTTPILATKLYIPPLRAEVVPRPQLVERLNTGLHRKLILVSAPAGFGKTTLVTEWVMGIEHPTAWLSLDEGDNDPTRFWSYFIHALQTILPDVAAHVLTIFQSPQLPPIESLLTMLLNEIVTIPDDFVVVLDDYHLIDSRPIDSALMFLLEHLPPRMHLVMTTREDPQFALPRLRARGQLIELRAADLRFTHAEAADFLNQVMGLTLTPKDIAILETRTEGWIAGLQLAAISMQGHQDASSFIESFNGNHHFVLDYLVEEVLHQQSEKIQTFLLSTSILERLCGSLCDAVLSDRAYSGQDILESIEHANLFLIPLDNERRWYRYHHLFADLLRQRLKQHAILSGDIDELHSRASQWYEDNGLEVEAFHHATAANDIARAERLIEGDGMPLYFRGAVTPVLHWLDSLPESVLDSRPALWVAYATAESFSIRDGDIEEKLHAAENAIQNIEPADNTRDLVGRIASIRAMRAINQHDVETIIAQSKRALEHLHPDNHSVRTSAIWTLAYAYQLRGDRAAARQTYKEILLESKKSGNSIYTIAAIISLGQVQESDNQLDMAAETYQQVLELTGDPPQMIACEAYLGLARIYYQWNDLELALQHAQQCAELVKHTITIDTPASCNLLLSRLKFAMGNVADATTTLDEAEGFINEHDFAFRLTDIMEERVFNLLQQGDLIAAADLAQKHDLPLGQARVYLARKDPSAALAILEPLHEQMAAKHWVDEQLKILVLQALAHQANGELETAVNVLNDALTLGRAGGFIRVFVDEGLPMARLLKASRAYGVDPEYVDLLLAAFQSVETGQMIAPHPNPPDNDLVEPLSERELEVLQLIAQGLSNREISERLYLALDTIKGHNRRIYAKLQVQRRTEAVARARELGLL